MFTGKNAQGKTNLLEAVYYLSALDSTRIKKDSELIKFNENVTSIKGTVNKGDVDIDLDVLINPPKNKIIKVNGIKKNKHKEFIRVLSVVSFSTQDLSLLRGEPNDRRKWLDLAISQVYPQYFEKLAKFNKIRLQKANYLSNFSYSKEMLDVFNEQFAIANSNIVYLRMKYLNEIKEGAKEKHKTISEDEELNIKYESETIKELMPIVEMTEIFKKALDENKEKEIQRGSCLVGAHRDDICFEISKCFMRMGLPCVASVSLKETILLDKNNLEAKLQLGVAHELMGEAQMALMVYQRIIEEHPSFLKAYQHKAALLVELNLYQEAASVFCELIKINPRYYKAVLGIGICFDKLGKTSSALRYYKKFLQLKPNSANAPDVISRMEQIKKGRSFSSNNFLQLA